MKLKGHIGTPMNAIEHGEINPIPCDCSRCYHCERTYWGGTYCRLRNDLNPNKKRCRFYSCERGPQTPKKKSGKKKQKGKSKKKSTQKK